MENTNDWDSVLRYDQLDLEFTGENTVNEEIERKEDASYPSSVPPVSCPAFFHLLCKLAYPY